MTSTPAAAALLELLRETFEGPQGDSTQFLDNRPDVGFFASVAGLSAEEASRPTRAGGASIAGHVHHVAFQLEVNEAWIRGDHAPRDWAESWIIRSVDEPAWGELRRELRRRYELLVAAVSASQESIARELPAALGAIAHAAYHLGAVRQAIAMRARAGESPARA